MDVGEAIINEIVSGRLFSVVRVGECNLVVWSANAAEQLSELVSRNNDWGDE